MLIKSKLFIAIDSKTFFNLTKNELDDIIYYGTK
jgi:hypothetical protein